jgi:hypothetical protein
LAHLTRADGILFLGVAILAMLFIPMESRKKRAVHILLLLSGYVLVFGFWMARNVSLYGVIFPPGNINTIWLIQYNDLFHFPSSELTMERFFQQGMANILLSRWDALVWNLQTLLFVLGMVFLFPFMVLGAWSYRGRFSFRIGLFYLGLLFVTMTCVYPLQGSRGGFFHSSAAFLPLAAILASEGMDRTIAWLSRYRHWNADEAKRFLLAGILFCALGSSVLIFRNRVIGGDLSHFAWQDTNLGYSMVAPMLPRDEGETIRVFVNNPPCFYLETGREAFAIPDGNLETLLNVADRYRVQYLLLDSNTPSGLISLYHGTSSNDRLKRIFELDVHGEEFVLYRILPK